MGLGENHIAFRVVIHVGPVIAIVIIHGRMNVSSFFDDLGDFEIFMRRCGRLLLVVVFKDFVSFDDFIMIFCLLVKLLFLLYFFVLMKEVAFSCRFFLDLFRFNV